MKVKLMAGLIFLIPVLIFVVQNSDPVTIRFLKWEYAVSQALLVFSALLIGVILGVLLNYFRRIKNNKKQKKADREIKQQTQEAQEPENITPEPVEAEKDILV